MQQFQPLDMVFFLSPLSTGIQGFDKLDFMNKGVVEMREVYTCSQLLDLHVHTSFQRSQFIWSLLRTAYLGICYNLLSCLRSILFSSLTALEY